MRRLIATCLVASLTACRPRPEPPPPPLDTAIRAADPRVANQFVSGVFAIEQGAWRWAAPEFSVKLRPPLTAKEKGALLKLNFTFPHVVFEKTGPLTISSRIGMDIFDPQTFTSPGNKVYTADVPARMLSSDIIQVDFQVDKFMEDGADKRRLSILVSTVGFETKK